MGAMYGEALINLIHREALRVLHRNTRRTPVVVDSYDPKTYAAKFKLQPDSIEQDVVTGWIPLHTLQSGNNFGWHSPPNVGDHGWLDFHEDDREGGTFTAATFNDKFQPVQVQAGEVMYQHKTGSQIYFKTDGTVTIKDKSGTDTIVMDGNGTVTITATTVKVVGDLKVTGAVIAGFGGGDQVGLQTHVHAQGNDSHGDAEVPTNPPTAGT
jgi:phage baseplate assembly protein gpV